MWPPNCPPIPLSPSSLRGFATSREPVQQGTVPAKQQRGRLLFLIARLGQISFSFWQSSFAHSQRSKLKMSYPVDLLATLRRSLVTNPYESPKFDCSTDPNQVCHPQSWRTVLYGLLGTFIGYICLTILANLEDRPFYTIRSLVTGETAPVKIMEHPADHWVLKSLMIGFILGGALVGIWLARPSLRKAQATPSAPL